MFAIHVVDMALEGCRSIDYAKPKNSVHVVTIAHTKHGLLLISEHYPEPIVRLADYKLRDIAGACQPVHHLANQWQ